MRAGGPSLREIRHMLLILERRCLLCCSCALTSAMKFPVSGKFGRRFHRPVTPFASRVPDCTIRPTSPDGIRTRRPTWTVVTFSSRIQRRTQEDFIRNAAANSWTVSKSLAWFIIRLDVLQDRRTQLCSVRIYSYCWRHVNGEENWWGFAIGKKN
jgi:hypothetical protein